MDHTTTPPAHTPTPWFYGHSENPDVYRNEPHWLVLSDPAESTGEAIADVETGPGPETAEANAEFIVRACNTHEGLVAACEWLMAELCEARDGTAEEVIPERIRDVIAEAKAGAA